MRNGRFRSQETDRIRQALSAHAAYHDALDEVSRAECEVIEVGVKVSELLLTPEGWRRVLAGVSDWSEVPLAEVAALQVDMGWCCEVVLEHLADELEALELGDQGKGLRAAADRVRAVRSRCRSGEGSLSSVTARTRICAGELRVVAGEIALLSSEVREERSRTSRRGSSCSG
jgi:hypothetical protein